MSIINLKAICVLLFFFTNVSYGEHIVFLHHASSYSHRVASSPLAEKLLSRGHQVTIIAPYPSKFPNPNITDIIPQGSKDLMDQLLSNSFGLKARLHNFPMPFVLVADAVNIISCQELLQTEEFKSWLHTFPKVDLIFADSLPECAYGLGFKLKAKVALFSPIVLIPRLYDQLGILDESSSIPTWDYRSADPLSFFERARNAVTVIAWYFSSMISSIWMERILRKDLDIPNFPGLEVMNKNLSLVLINGHFIDEHPRSLPPFVVSIPGIHVKETHQPLPTHLEDIINSANPDGSPSEGFVYISLGTVVSVDDLPQSVREVFFSTIKAFPNVKFLWKWSGVFPLDGPRNVYFSKWFDQQDVLGHPGIRAFIFQAGRPSTQEALCNAVPMITFPVLGDQDFNANRLQNLGVSINLEIGTTTASELKNALSSVLYNGQFKTNALKMAKLFKDLPMKPVDTAVWWTEYILRHDDTSHLKPVGRNQMWYQRRLLDVWLFITLIIACSFYFTFVVFRLFCRLNLRKTMQKLKSL